MVRHVVGWNFQDDFSAEENKAHAEKAKYELERLKKLIPGIVELKVLISPAPESTRQIMLIGLFYTEKDLNHYQSHPQHESVGIFISSVFKDRICFDFYES